MNKKNDKIQKPNFVSLNMTMEEAWKKAKPLKNNEKKFYICSYGGCGSTVLFNYLKKFGEVEHIHDRNPPEKLSYIGSKNTSCPVYSEWFNSTLVKEENIKDVKVIYIYRDPIDAIFSRCLIKRTLQPHIEHLKHIMVPNPELCTLERCIKSQTDIWGLEHFYNNYVNNRNKNYDIIAVKYENLWDPGIFRLLHKILNIPYIPQNIPPKKRSVINPRTLAYIPHLLPIYFPFIKKIKHNKPIMYIKNT